MSFVRQTVENGVDVDIACRVDAGSSLALNRIISNLNTSAKMIKKTYYEVGVSSLALNEGSDLLHVSYPVDLSI